MPSPKKLKKKLTLQQIQAILGTFAEGVTGLPNPAREALGEQISATALELQEAELEEQEGSFLEQIGEDIIGTAVGTAASAIPVVGPFVAPIAEEAARGGFKSVTGRDSDFQFEEAATRGVSGGISGRIGKGITGRRSPRIPERSFIPGRDESRGPIDPFPRFSRPDDPGPGAPFPRIDSSKDPLNPPQGRFVETPQLQARPAGEVEAEAEAEPRFRDRFLQELGSVLERRVTSESASRFERRTAPSAFGLPSGFVERFGEREDRREAEFNANRRFEEGITRDDARFQSTQEAAESRFVRGEQGDIDRANIVQRGAESRAQTANRNRQDTATTLAERQQTAADEARKLTPEQQGALTRDIEAHQTREGRFKADETRKEADEVRRQEKHKLEQSGGGVQPPLRDKSKVALSNKAFDAFLVQARIAMDDPQELRSSLSIMQQLMQDMDEEDLRKANLFLSTDPTFRSELSVEGGGRTMEDGTVILPGVTRIVGPKGGRSVPVRIK